ARRDARRQTLRDFARDALEVNRLAGPIQPAVALDEAADLRRTAAAILRQTEVPDLEPVRPVAIDDGEVATLLDDRDQALTAIAVRAPVLAVPVIDGVRLLEQRAERDLDHAIGVGGVDPLLLARRGVQRDRRTGERIAGRQRRDAHETRG